MRSGLRTQSLLALDDFVGSPRFYSQKFDEETVRVGSTVHSAHAAVEIGRVELPGALEEAWGEEPRAGNHFSRTALKGWPSGLSPAWPSLLQTRACRGAHNDNTSSIFAWNDGRLDAIACHFWLVLVPHAV